jgi:hypothetical protein
MNTATLTDYTGTLPRCLPSTGTGAYVYGVSSRNMEYRYVRLNVTADLLICKRSVFLWFSTLTQGGN